MVPGFLFYDWPPYICPGLSATPLGRLDYALAFASNARPGFFIFCVGRLFVGAGCLAGKMSALQIIEH